MYERFPIFKPVRKLPLLFIALLFSFGSAAQDIRWIKHQIATLCGPQMDGRGYYGKGRDKAASYIQRKFKEFGLKGFGPDSAYTQQYTFPVNTFPGVVSLTVNKREMHPSADFLVDAASTGGEAEKMKIIIVDFSSKKVYRKIDSLANIKQFISKQNVVYLLKNTDTICKKLSISQRELRTVLLPGRYIIPHKGKLMWTVATDTIPSTIFYVADTSLPKRPKKTTFTVGQKFETSAKSQNVFGYVPGTIVPDSFIVFTAHYDHLGHMGHDTEFPGASDNASGTAMMLFLANYFAQHPQRYSIAFIAFSGEEAGLLGSKYYVNHPVFELEKIRFLTNIDIMGDATNGITVVNATEHPTEFALLQQINDFKAYLPAVNSRGKTSNSDHYWFSEKGVPAIFIYSNGGAGFYHDVFDKPNTLSLKNVEGVYQLLQDFVGLIQ